MNTQEQPPGGLFASLRGLLQTVLSIAQNRLELLVTELEEERQRLRSVLLWGALAFLLLGAGLVFLAMFLTVLFWDSNRLLVLGVICAVFLSFGFVATAFALRSALRQSRLFKASLAELSQDQIALQRAAEKAE